MARILIAAIIFLILVQIGVVRADELLWPLPDSRKITGGFADSRPDHFHGGVDLRTQGKNLPVVAPEDGWIERFAVSPTGYGRTLYFRLPDGRTAVFGHLSLFAPPLESMLRDSQLVAETYRVDCVFDRALPELEFDRGDTLAFSGSTGIGPPHLHFEFREGAVQVDPLAAFEPLDHQPPVIARVWWTTLSKYSPTSHGTGCQLNSIGENRKTTAPIIAREPIAFFIQTYDPGPWGRNAVPAVVRLKRNGKTIYETYPARIDLLGAHNIYDRIVWSDRRNADVDIQRVFSVPPPVSFGIPEMARNGWISDAESDSINIEVEDRAGNTSDAVVIVQSGPWPEVAPVPTRSELKAGSFVLDCQGDMSSAWAQMRGNSPREISVGTSDFAFGDRHKLTYNMAADESLPGLYYYEKKAGGARRALWRIANEDKPNTISCWILRGGTYGVAEDHDPPRLLISTRSGKLIFNLTDADSGIDDSTVRCQIDHETAIPEFEYEEHGGAIWTQNPLSRGKHDVEFQAADRAGNHRSWSLTVTTQ